MRSIYHNFLALTIAASCVCPAAGQQLTPQSIGSAGQSFTNAGLLLESHVGGLVVADVSTAVFLYTPGFLQPDAGSTQSVPEINNVVLSSGAGIDAAGGSLQAGSALLEFTVGEFASITHQQSNTLLTQGLLQPFQWLVSLPVTDLDFRARRVQPHLVQLDWKTLQESNSKGFHIERKNDNETGFRSIGFQPSKAADGNSALPLTYQATDPNAHAGKSWYRLRQEDTDGTVTYSTVRLVAGSGDKPATLRVWPVPSNGPVTVQVDGIDKEVLQVFDTRGRLVQQRTVVQGTSQTIGNLPPGTYIIRLAGTKDLFTKAIIQ